MCGGNPILGCGFEHDGINATRPRSTRSKPHAPTADEVRATLERVSNQDPEFADAFTVLATTRMRKAELLGLQWDDVDIASGEVHISAAITDAGTCCIMLPATRSRLL